MKCDTPPPSKRKKVSIECPERAGSFVVRLKPHTALTSKREQKEKMTNRIKAIPEGHHTLTPHLVVKGASQAIEFYKKAFGAEEITRVPGPDGKSLIHAAIKIGDSRLFLVDEFPEMGSRGPHSIGGTSVTIHVYVEDVDSVFNQAVTAGAIPALVCHAMIPEALHKGGSAVVLPAVASYGDEAFGNYLAAMLNDAKLHDAVKLYALKGLRQFFKANPPQPANDVQSVRESDIPRIEAVLADLGMLPVAAQGARQTAVAS